MRDFIYQIGDGLCRESLLGLIAAIPCGLCIVNGMGQIMQANPQFCEALDYTSEQLKAMRFQDIIHPRDFSANLAMAKKVLDGETTRYRLRALLLKNRGGIFDGFLIVTGILHNGNFQFFMVQLVEAESQQPQQQAKQTMKMAFAGFKVETKLVAIAVGGIAIGALMDFNKLAMLLKLFIKVAP